MASDDTADDQAATAAAGNDETTIVPPPTEVAPELAWSHDDVIERIERRSWRSAVGVAAALMVGGSLLAAAVSFGFWASHQDSRSHQSAVPPAAPAIQTVPQQNVTAPAQHASTPTPSAPVSAPPTTKPALPAAVEGSSCRLQSTPTVDLDGVIVYCALFPDMPETAMWSRTPGPLAWPTIGGVRVPDQEGSYPWVVVCEQQTGRTYNYCDHAIAQATYQGDGLIPVG